MFSRGVRVCPALSFFSGRRLRLARPTKTGAINGLARTVGPCKRSAAGHHRWGAVLFLPGITQRCGHGAANTVEAGGIAGT